MFAPPSPSGPLQALRGLVLALGCLVVCSLGAARPAASSEAAASRQTPLDAALEPLEPWLRHSDWTVRSIAAFELRKRTETGVVLLATRLLATEKHPYAAAGALGALRGRPRQELVMEGGATLVQALLRWAAHEHPTVRTYAREVLFSVPPVRLGDKLALYQGWWKRGRTALEHEQELLLDAYRKARAQAGDAASPGHTSSVAPESESKQFYGRLETMRRYGLELCIVMDHTGSMGSVIGYAKAGAQSLIERLGAYVPRFRAGLVTYDDAARLRIPLTNNAEGLAKAFGKVGAGGGGDFEEGVDKGIRMALQQGRLGWSQRAYRVIVVVGDAPPHKDDVPGLLRLLGHARKDELYDRPIVIHTVSTATFPVEHFPQIAIAGGGRHVKLSDSGSLVDALVLLSFGGADEARVQAWMREIDALKAAAKKTTRRK